VGSPAVPPGFLDPPRIPKREPAYRGSLKVLVSRVPAGLHRRAVAAGPNRFRRKVLHLA